jgi:hypothetical protein
MGENATATALAATSEYESKNISSSSISTENKAFKGTVQRDRLG